MSNININNTMLLLGKTNNDLSKFNYSYIPSVTSSYKNRFGPSDALFPGGANSYSSDSNNIGKSIYSLSTYNSY